MQRSIFGRYSLGVIAENKPLDSNKVQVLPVETLNLMDGELSAATVDRKSSGLREDGTEYTVTVKMGATIEAEWLGETNRLTAPDVRRGEQVWIWQSENVDGYYWTSLGRDDDQRRLETVVYRYSGLAENVDEKITKDNSYFLEFSTHNKTITLQTSQRNGEICRYTFQLDPGDGRATLEDDFGNIIQIRSPETIITVTNADKSFVEMNKKQIRIQSNESISLKSELINIEAPDIRLDCDALEIVSKQTRIHGTLQVDGILTTALQVLAPILAPGISGAPFVPGPAVPPFTKAVKKVDYPF